MDKRAKKRIKGLRTKIETLKRKLQGAREQADDPGEEKRVLDEIDAALAQIEVLKKS